MDRIRLFLLGLPRRQKRLIQVLTDVVLVWAALWLAFIVRLGIDEMVNPFKVHFWLFVLRRLSPFLCLSASACTVRSCAISATMR